MRLTNITTNDVVVWVSDPDGGEFGVLSPGKTWDLTGVHFYGRSGGDWVEYRDGDVIGYAYGAPWDTSPANVIGTRLLERTNYSDSFLLGFKVIAAALLVAYVIRWLKRRSAWGSE